MLDIPLSFFIWMAVILFQALVHYGIIGPKALRDTDNSHHHHHHHPSDFETKNSGALTEEEETTKEDTLSNYESESDVTHDSSSICDSICHSHSHGLSHGHSILRHSNGDECERIDSRLDDPENDSTVIFVDKEEEEKESPPQELFDEYYSSSYEALSSNKYGFSYLLRQRPVTTIREDVNVNANINVNVNMNDAEAEMAAQAARHVRFSSTASSQQSRYHSNNGLLTTNATIRAH